jgi:hypothetical protein
LAQKLNQKVAFESLVEQLGEEIKVGYKGSLEDDGYVRGIEQFDWVGGIMSADFGVFNW